jgi:hypothetical protein
VANQTLTFTLEGRDRLSSVLDKAGDSSARLQTKLALVSAAVPAAAALAPLISQTGAAAVAVAAFGAAIVPQISALSDASQAQKKYEAAVSQSGATSDAALKAQGDYQRQLASMPTATQRASIALGDLKDQFKGWSDSLAGATMTPFTQGLAVASRLLPKLTPMVQGAGAQFQRLTTLLGGAVQTPGFDRLSAKFSAFAVGSLKKAVDGVVHLTQVLSSNSGAIGGGLSKFMAYAQQQGPVLWSTLENIGKAVVNLLQASSETGVGVLQLANSLAKMVAAVPPGFIALLMQASLAIRGVRLAVSGVQLVAGGLSLLRTQLVQVGTAAFSSSGFVRTLRDSFMALSIGARTALAATGIGLLIVALTSLSKIGKKAPADVDALTTSLGKLISTGQASGETARLFGTNLSQMYDAVRNITDPSLLDTVQQWGVKILSLGMSDSTPHSDALDKIDALDKSLAQLVQNGNGKEAALEVNALTAAYVKGGGKAADFQGHLKQYNQALADQAFQAKLTAQSQGLFGTQAQQVQAKLDAQKSSADGLRQSLQALNDVNRQGIGGMIGFEQSISDAAKAAKDNGKSLHMVNGQLVLTSQKARDNATALNNLAASTDDASAKARDSGKSWTEVQGIYERGRQQFIKNAQAMGLNAAQAKNLADQILTMPDKTTILKGNADDLKAQVATAQAKVDSLKQKRATAVGANKASLDTQVKAAQRELDAVKQKQAAAIRASDQTGPGVAAAKANIGSVVGKTVSVMVQYRASHSSASAFAKSIGGYASGGRPKAGELAWVGEKGPELMRFSGGEEIYDHQTSKGMGTAAASGAVLRPTGLDAGRGLAQGLMDSLSRVGQAARVVAGAVTTGVRTELDIHSPSKKMKALAHDAAAGLVEGLTGSKAKITAVSKDLVKDIWAAWSGTKSTKDSTLVKMVTKDTAKLQSLASQRDALTSKIAGAKANAATWTANARSDSALNSLGLDDSDVSAGSIKAALTAQLAKIKQFTAYVKTLGQRGLAKSMLKQILDMGPDQGYAYASALAGASNSTLASITQLQYSINSSTDALGKQGADSMYDAGKDAGKGFLTGLQSQQKAIEAQMTKMAKSMTAAIKKALGIKSPSRVMAEVGRYSTDGLAAGLTDRMPVLDDALAAVSGRVAGTRPVIGAPAVGAGVAGAGGGAQTIHATFEIATLDPIAAAKQVRKVLLELRRTYGVNVDLLTGGI